MYYSTKPFFFFQGLTNICPRCHQLHYFIYLHLLPDLIKKLSKLPKLVGNGFHKTGKWMKIIMWIRMDGNMVAGIGRHGVPSLLAYACSHDADTGLEMHVLLKSQWAMISRRRSTSLLKDQIRAHLAQHRYLRKTHFCVRHLLIPLYFKGHHPQARVNILWNHRFSPTTQIWKVNYGYAANENTFFPCIILYYFFFFLYLITKIVFSIIITNTHIPTNFYPNLPCKVCICNNYI